MRAQCMYLLEPLARGYGHRVRASLSSWEEEGGKKEMRSGERVNMFG
jgi:hypothetical protein